MVKCSIFVWSMQKDLNTEQKIKEAAKKVFIQKGLTGARMQEIADAAGINKHELGLPS